MFEALNEVQWDEYETAHGDASEVPTLLRAVSGADKARARQALVQLDDALNHQGVPAPVASIAIPFLIELCVSKTVNERERILVLLANLASGGNHEIFVGVQDPFFEVDSFTAEEPGLVEVHAAVAAGAAVFKSLLTDAPTVRSAAAMVLSFLPEYAADTSAELDRLLPKEKSAIVRASWLLARTMLAQRNDARPNSVLLAALEDSAAMVRLCGAWGLYVAGQSAADLVAHCEAVASEPDATAKKFPWLDGETRRFAFKLLSAYANGSGRPDLLLGLVDRLPESELFYVFQGLLKSRFEDVEEPYPRSYRGLSAEQKTILRHVIDRGYVGRLSLTLNRKGLWSDDQELNRMLVADGSLALDVEFNDEPAYRWILKVLDGTRPLHDWVEQLRSKPEPEYVVALCHDAGQLGYNLNIGWPYRSLPEHRVSWEGERLATLLQTSLEQFASTEAVRAYMDELAGVSGRNRQCAIVARTYVELLAKNSELLPERYDSIVARGLRYERLSHRTLELLPVVRRTPLILDLAMFHFMKKDDYVMVGAWHFVDLVPGPEIAAKALEAILQAPKCPPPKTIALQALMSGGGAMVERLEQALKAHDAPHREFLQQALDALQGKAG